jgi:type II secretory pathway pseudopilin PulG
MPHNIEFEIQLTRNPGSNAARAARTKHSNDEGGYALVAMLVVMSLMALFAMAAAPNVKQQAQREREKEAIFRGEQVADAIRLYYRSRGAQGTNSLPTNMEQLVEGIQIPGRTKRLQVLRASAAKDPLSTSGEWKLVTPTSQDFAELVRNLTIYTDGVPPTPKAEFQTLAQFITQSTNILNTKSSSDAPGGEDNSESASGPFVGVASRSQHNSVITYYGIDRHDQWIFTPIFR